MNNIDNKTKLVLALMQIENVSNLMQNNAWFGFMSSHLIPLKFEMERQVANLTHDEKFTKI